MTISTNFAEIPNTADWKQAPYVDERESENRATMLRMAEHTANVWAACVEMGAQMIYNG